MLVGNAQTSKRVCRQLQHVLRSARLMEHNNTTYQEYIKNHKRLLAERHVDGDRWWMVPTAELPMQMPGVEVAARPILCSLASCGDTDIKIRLVSMGNPQCARKFRLEAAEPLFVVR